MKITYDSDADAMYIYLDENSEVDRTKQIDDNTIIDIDKKGRTIGIELLFVRETRPQLLKQIQFENLVPIVA